MAYQPIAHARRFLYARLCYRLQTHFVRRRRIHKQRRNVIVNERNGREWRERAAARLSDARSHVNQRVRARI